MNCSKILSIINTVLFIGVITINALANILPINNYTTGELSDMIPNLFVPAGLTFSIWGIIYIMLAILVVANIFVSFKRDTKEIELVNILLSINFLFNTFWILTWHYRLIYLSLAVMFVIFSTLQLLDKTIYRSTFKEKKIYYYLPISIYFGWISVATIANITAVLVTIGWRGEPLTEEIWTVIIISAGAIIASIKVIKHKNIPFVLVFIWAYTGIIIKRLNTAPVYSSIIFTAAISIFTIVIASIYSLKKIKGSKKSLS